MIEHLHPKVRRPNIKDMGAILTKENRPRFFTDDEAYIHDFRARHLRKNNKIERYQS